MTTTKTVRDELSLALRSGDALLYLVTHEEGRALELVASAAEQLGRRVFAWTSARGLGPARGNATPWDARLADPMAVCEHALRADDRSVYVLLDPHVYLGNPLLARRLKDAALRARARGGAVVLVAPTLVLPPELARLATVLDVPAPDDAELARVLDAALRLGPGLGPGLGSGPSGAREPLGVGGEEREALLRAARGLTEDELAQALARALARGGDPGRPRLGAATVEAVLEAKRQAIRKTGVLDLAREDATGEGLDGVGGLEALKRWLHDRALGFSDRARAYGLEAPRGVLLVGVQGSGKSLCARAAAAAWRMPLLRLDLGAVFTGVVGGSEASLRQALALAEGVAPCVLWVDELERGFAGVDGGASDGGAASRVFGTFLTWLQEHRAPVFVAATANAVDRLPAELLRKGRFDEIFFVDLPGPAERVSVLRIHLARRGRDPSRFDLESLAESTEGFSGAELEQAVLAGMFFSFADGRELETRDVQRAARETVPLSRTMSEQVAALRKWAEGRARPASSGPLSGAARRVSV